MCAFYSKGDRIEIFRICATADAHVTMEKVLQVPLGGRATDLQPFRLPVRHLVSLFLHVICAFLIYQWIFAGNWNRFSGFGDA